jgi:hypothetical protein
MFLFVSPFLAATDFLKGEAGKVTKKVEAQIPSEALPYPGFNDMDVESNSSPFAPAAGRCPGCWDLTKSGKVTAHC